MMRETLDTKVQIRESTRVVRLLRQLAEAQGIDVSDIYRRAAREELVRAGLLPALRMIPTDGTPAEEAA